MMRQYELVERVRRYNPNADEDLLNRAYVFAMKAHGAQKRASGDPFFSHPLEVAAILTDLKFDDATIVAAVLHDTIEDTAATREDIGTLRFEEAKPPALPCAGAPSACERSCARWTTDSSPAQHLDHQLHGGGQRFLRARGCECRDDQASL